MPSIVNYLKYQLTARKLAKIVLGSRRLNGWQFYQNIYSRLIKKTALNLSQAAPLAICIETTSACNANCLMCPRSIGQARSAAMMTDALFQKILTDCARFKISDIELNVFGEPLVDPKIFQRIRLAKQMDFTVSFFSNAGALSKEKAQALLDSKCDRVTFSVDGISREVYESIRIGLKRDDVYRNINYLLWLKQKQGKSLPEISVSGILMDRNRPEMKRFLRYWRQRPGIKRVLMVSLRNWSGSFSEAKLGRLGELSQPTAWRPPCLQLWQGLNIFYDGRVPMCCDDAALGRVIIGDATRESVGEIWHGRRLAKIRQAHSAGKQSQIPICQGCQRLTVWWPLIVNHYGKTKQPKN